MEDQLEALVWARCKLGVKLLMIFIRGSNLLRDQRICDLSVGVWTRLAMLQLLTLFSRCNGNADSITGNAAAQ